MRLFFVSIFLMFAYVSLQAQLSDSVKFQSLGPNDFHQQYLREDPALLIDVREFFEYKGNRIKNAVNIPSSGNLEISGDTIDKNTALFFYCSTGYRSKRVAEYFYDKGFRKLYNLDGGIVGWKKEGLPVQKGKVKRKRK